VAVALGSLLAGGMGIPGGRSHVVAAETPVTEKSASSSTAEMRIEDWIKQLDAPEYAQRKEAAGRLVEAGKPALPAVREAAHSSNREVSERALEILKRQFGSLDPQVKEAARLALEEMSRSETTRVASAARGILNPNAVPPAAAQLAKAQVLAAARARAL